MTDPAFSQFLYENTREILKSLIDDLVGLAGDEDFNKFLETNKLKIDFAQIKTLDKSTQQLINTITNSANTLNNANFGKWKLDRNTFKIIQVTKDDGIEDGNNVDNSVSGGTNYNCDQISQFLVYKIVKGLFGALITKSFITVWNIIATILGIIFGFVSAFKSNGFFDDAKNLRIFLQNIDNQYWDEIDKGIEQLKDKKKCSDMFFQKFSNLLTTIYKVKESIKNKFPKR